MRQAAVQQMAEVFMDMAANLPLRFSWKLADFLGRVWFHLDRKHRQIALSNLKIARGEELSENERKVIARRNFIHLAQVVLELPYLRKLNPDDLDGYVAFHGVEHFEMALKKGRGVLLLASHFGNWELMALAFSLHYRPVHLVVRPLDSPFLDTLITKIRTRGGNQLIPKKGSVQKMLRLLKAGDAVALLLDQNPAWYEGVFVPFFNEIACTNKTLGTIALRTGAPVVPVFNVRQPDGTYGVFFEPEIVLSISGDTTRDVEENTAKFNKIIETYIRRYPEQWFWVHQRWKTRPYKPWPREM
ncbi:MAG: lysophospholipid acyltransferase family protein [Deltaproteobacteria bacterium]|nr:lysophospholipid acyltransferase family protein [Deltaproteobacteria bacterium]